MVLELRAILDATVWLLHCDQEVMGSNQGNILFACEGKAAYNDPP